jgi:ferredoxin-NADP reductase
VVLPSDVLFQEELDRLAASRGVRVQYVVGDHATAQGRGLLSPAHLRELVPDIDERDVYLCGPPAMTAVLERSLRHARVPRGHIHVERFAI